MGLAADTREKEGRKVEEEEEGEKAGRVRGEEEEKKRARLRLTIRGHRAKLSVLPAIGRREIHNTFFIDAGRAALAGIAPAELPLWRGIGVESRVDSLQSRRVEPSPVSSLERFAGRLRAFDPKCTVGAREVEEAEEYRREREREAKEGKEKSLSCVAPLIGYVVHASS